MELPLASNTFHHLHLNLIKCKYLLLWCLMRLLLLLMLLLMLLLVMMANDIVVAVWLMMVLQERWTS